MRKTKTLTFKPYTSITISSLPKEDELLQAILSSKIKLFPRKIDKPVILYGAGSLGKMAKDFFTYLNIPFLYIVDKKADLYKNDKNWKGLDIIYPGKVKEADKKNCLLVICVVTSPLIALRNELKDSGWKDIAFFYDVCEAYKVSYPLSNGWFLNKLAKNEIKAVKKVFFVLYDISRMYYLQFLAWRKLRIELLFKNLKIDLNNRFFISEVLNVLNDSEVFIDCGAHKGFVTEKFLKTINNKYKTILAIEPDDINFEILEKKLKYVPNTATIKCALSNKNSKEKFYQGFDFASTLNKGGNKVVEAVTLDSLKLKPTFIKIHLEGGELDALKGAVNTIQKYRPIIAVTIYHNSDGVWKIPLFLIRNAKHYKYHLRLHSWGGTGAVLYAIPKEKIEYKVN